MALKQPRTTPKIEVSDAEDCAEDRTARKRIMVRKLDLHALRQPQGPNSGINAIIGKWPGDERDEEEVIALIEEIS